LIAFCAEIKAVNLLVSNLSNTKTFHTQTITDAEYKVVDKVRLVDSCLQFSLLSFAAVVVADCDGRLWSAFDAHACAAPARGHNVRQEGREQGHRFDSVPPPTVCHLLRFADIVSRLASIAREADKSVTALLAARALANCFRSVVCVACRCVVLSVAVCVLFAAGARWPA
jgi:hypothetical protein